MIVTKDIAQDTVSLTFTEKEIYDAAYYHSEAVTVARLIAKLVQYAESDLPVFDGTRSPIQGVGIMMETETAPHRIVLW